MTGRWRISEYKLSRLKGNYIILAISLNHTVFPACLFMMLKKLQTFHSLYNTKQTLKQMTEIKCGMSAELNKELYDRWREHSVCKHVFIWHAGIDLWPKCFWPTNILPITTKIIILGVVSAIYPQKLPYLLPMIILWYDDSFVRDPLPNL